MNLMPKRIHLNRFPLKHAWDTLSLAQVLLRGPAIYGKKKIPLNFGQRMDCLKFYFHANGVRRLHAMLPRTGSHWSELGMTLAIDLAKGGDGEYTYEAGLYLPRDGLASRRLDWRVPMGSMYIPPRRSHRPGLGEHLFYHSRNPYYRLRCAKLKKFKIVVLTRSIIISLVARYIRHKRDPDHPEGILDSDDSFDWDGFLTEGIEFNNSWGDVLTWHPSIRLYRYEDLVRDPVSLHKEILDFWGFDVPEECVAEGFRKASVEGMKKRMSPKERAKSIRIPQTVRNHGTLLSKDRKKHIIERLNKEVIHSFGYEYDYDQEYRFDFI